MSDYDDDLTPVDGGTIEANALRNVAISLVAIARDLNETARLVDVTEKDYRRHLLVSVAAKLGELGDLAHEARRIVSDAAT